MVMAKTEPLNSTSRLVSRDPDPGSRSPSPRLARTIPTRGTRRITDATSARTAPTGGYERVVNDCTENRVSHRNTVASDAHADEPSNGSHRAHGCSVIRYRVAEVDGLDVFYREGGEHE